MELIVAVDEKGGIGYENRIPWYCKQDLALFKRKTSGKTIIVGRKTAETLPKLIGRKIICVTRNLDLDTSNWNNNVILTDKLIKEGENIIIAGGSQIYEQALKDESVTIVYLSIIKKEYKCDAFFKFEWLKNFVIVQTKNYPDFINCILVRTEYGEEQYLNLLRTIITEGEKKNCRNGNVISIFKNDIKFDLRNGFPLLTTKKMFIRGVIEEFLFFLRGDTNSTVLSEKGIKIWEANTSKEFILSVGLPYSNGVMGPMYGYQWRFFNSPYTLDENGIPTGSNQGGIDQLADVVNLIKTDPNSRRILMTAYNPAQAKLGVLYPCHSIMIQFYVQDNNLDMFCYNRSQDCFLGLPFNIASSSLLLLVVAKLTSKNPRLLHITMGDAHIYSEHIEQAKVQIKKLPYASPTMVVFPDLKSVEDIIKLSVEDFILSDYVHYPAIPAKMIA